MELKDFIKNALVGVVEGIDEAKENSEKLALA